MRLGIVLFILLIVSASAPALAFAAEEKAGFEERDSHGVTQTLHEDAPKSWGFSVGLSGNSTLHESMDVNGSQYLQISAIPSYQFNESFIGSLYFIQNQKLKADRDLTICDSGIGLSYAGFHATPYFKVSGAIGSKIPLAKTLRDDDSLITTFSVAPKAALDLSHTRFSRLNASYGLALRRAFHRYETSASGDSNDQYRVNQSLVLGLDLSEKVSFTSAFQYSSRWTYRSTLFNRYSFDEALSYQATRAFSIALGLGNSGDGLKANGFDSNIAVFDKNSTEVSLGATYVF